MPFAKNIFCVSVLIYFQYSVLHFKVECTEYLPGAQTGQLLKLYLEEVSLKQNKLPHSLKLCKHLQQVDRNAEKTQQHCIVEI